MPVCYVPAALPLEPHLSRKNILIAAAIAVILITGAIVAYFTLAGDGTQTASTTPEATNSSFPSAGGTPTGKPGELPDPVIGILDRNAILMATKVGQDINRQMQDYTNSARNRLAGERRAIENEIRALQDLPAAEQAKRGQALQAREQRFMAASAREENILKASMGTAHNEIAKVMGPIVQEVTKARGINMVLDRSAINLAASQEFDLTPEVIKQLDARISTYKVTLVTPK